jgi:asparagine synthetase B (glutamine-hydrolysing)
MGRPLGMDPGAPALSDDGSGQSPREALWGSMLEALTHPPCLVMFSGGRDSSGLLALAALVARAEGLEAPVAFTLRFPGVQKAAEDEWQDTVVRHVGIGEWLRKEIHDELDLVGPYGSGMLLRHGLVWPPNAFVVSLAAEQARGGSVITGSFGDELFTQGGHVLRLRGVLAGELPRRRRDLARIWLARAPRRLRRMVVARRRRGRALEIPPWVGAQLHKPARAALLDELADSHLRWDEELRSAWRRRYTQMVRSLLSRLAAEAGAGLVMPYDDPRFRMAFARLGGRRGFFSRTEAMHSLFEDLLPPAVLDRPTKAVFSGVFWNRHAKEFADGWHGEGLNRRLVDVQALESMWSWEPSGEARPDFRSACLFQAAWLAGRGLSTPVMEG